MTFLDLQRATASHTAEHAIKEACERCVETSDSQACALCGEGDKRAEANETQVKALAVTEEVTEKEFLRKADETGPVKNVLTGGGRDRIGNVLAVGEPDEEEGTTAPSAAPSFMPTYSPTFEPTSGEEREKERLLLR